MSLPRIFSLVLWNLTMLSRSLEKTTRSQLENVHGTMVAFLKMNCPIIPRSLLTSLLFTVDRSDQPQLDVSDPS